MHKEFLRILSRNPEYVKTHCNDNSFHCNVEDGVFIIKQTKLNR